MFIAGLIITIISTAMAAYGQYSAGQQQKKVAEAQAKMADLQADAEMRRGEREEREQRRYIDQIVGKQRAAFAAAGVSAAGTPLLVMAETVQQGERDIRRLQEETDARVLSARVSGGLFRAEGEYAASSGTFAAGTTLLSGVGSGLAGYSSYKSQTAKGAEG